MNEAQLHEKLDRLFEQRQISTYAQHVGLSSKYAEELISTLKGLQVIIYRIDQLLESVRQIDSASHEQIMKRWADIKKMVGEEVENDSNTDTLLERLRQFFQMEIRMRQGISPASIAIDDFYALKICDIHLQRELVKDKSHRKITADAWKAVEQYDKLWEIIDDVEDLQEDMQAVNSNRFMLKAYQDWLESTQQEYSIYIEQLRKEILPYMTDIMMLLGDHAQTPSQLVDQVNYLVKNVTLPEGKPLLVELLAVYHDDLSSPRRW